VLTSPVVDPASSPESPNLPRSWRVSNSNPRDSLEYESAGITNNHKIAPRTAGATTKIRSKRSYGHKPAELTIPKPGISIADKSPSPSLLPYDRDTDEEGLLYSPITPRADPRTPIGGAGPGLERRKSGNPSTSPRWGGPSPRRAKKELPRVEHQSGDESEGVKADDEDDYDTILTAYESEA
jgi:hypothetical protein